MILIFLAGICMGAMGGFPRAHALEFQIEPRVSYQKTRLYLPTRDDAYRYLYGVRLSLGVPVFALETEYLYLRGTRRETVNGVPEVYADMIQDLRGGVRFVPRIVGPLGWELRGGVGTRLERIGSIIQTTEVVTDSTPTVYSYFGTGLSLRLGSRLRVQVGVTGVIHSWTAPDADVQVQTGIAWSVW